MTQEEKAKAYDEALERAKKVLLDKETTNHNVAEFIFPELRESEDERIRKEIISFFKGMIGPDGKAATCGVHDWIAYLENLKEQTSNIGKMTEEVNTKFVEEQKVPKQGLIYGKEQKSVEDEVYLKELEDAIKLYYETYGNGKGGFDYMSYPKFEDIVKTFVFDYGQKPAEWSEDWREEDIKTRFAFYTYKDDPSVLYLSNVFVEEASRNHGFGTRILKAAEKAAEAIGAITICLKVKQDSPANAWYRKRGYGYVAFEDGYDWLEKNLEYLKPIKQEWSEEDEECLRNVRINFEINNEKMTPGLLAEYDKFFNKIKSLRPNWKPTEEQMIVLDGCIQHWMGNLSAKEILVSLQNDLKTKL